MEVTEKGRVVAHIGVLSQHLPGITEENHDRLQYIWCPGRDSNRTLPEHGFRPLPLRQPTDYRDDVSQN
jgi:hypothetical protein